MPSSDRTPEPEIDTRQRWPTLSRPGATCCDMPGRSGREPNAISTGKIALSQGSSGIRHGLKAIRWMVDDRNVFLLSNSAPCGGGSSGGVQNEMQNCL
jgi:hypothetical protein